MGVIYKVRTYAKYVFTDYKDIEREYEESENFFFNDEQEAFNFLEKIILDCKIITKDRKGKLTNIEVFRIEKLKEVAVCSEN